MRAAASLILAGVVLLPLAAQAAGPEAAAALTALDAIEAEAGALRLEVRAVNRLADARIARGETPLATPSSLERQIELLQRRIDLTRNALVGQRWREVASALRRGDGLQGRLERLRERLRAPRPAPRRKSNGRASDASAGAGGISGRVVDALSGAPVEATIDVYDSSEEYVGSWKTSGGSYAAAGLAADSYYVLAHDQSSSHVDELYDDVPCPYYYCDLTAGTPVSVADGHTTAGINFALTPTGTVTGRVLDATTRQPLPQTEIKVYDSNGGAYDYSLGYTTDDGSYEVRGVPPGTHYVLAASNYYLDQVYPGLPCQPCEPTSGTPIVVASGGVRSGVDFQLQRGGSISGTVLEETTGTAVIGYVDVYDAQGRLYAMDWITDGEYQVYDLPTGSYFAETSTYALDELYDGLPCETSCTVTAGTPIAVVQAQNHAGIDFVLTPFAAGSGSISGSVTDVASDQPVASVVVRSVDASGVLGAWDYTRDTGSYRLWALNPGAHFVYTVNYRYVDQLYQGLLCDPSCDPTTGTAITVTADADTGPIDFQLALGGWVTGTVTAAAGGGPLSSAEVSLYRSDGSLVDAWLDTDLNGRYLEAGLVGGTYYAVAGDYSGEYASELYRELPCEPNCDPTSGTPISVATSLGTSGIDFTLDRFGVVKGRVTELLTGLPASAFGFLDVVAQSPATGFSATGYVQWDGRYSIGGLEPGTYYVYTKMDSGAVIDQLYPGRTCEPTCNLTQGTPIAVSFGTVAPGIDFVLRRPIFADVLTTHWAWKFVEAVSAAGVTSGCGTSPLRFCPNNGVTRGQVTLFLLRGKEGASYLPPAATGLFADVPKTEPLAPWVEEVYRRGITAGCATNPLRFCPGAALTRGQVAPFLLLTKEGSGYKPPACGTPMFADVPASSPLCAFIEEVVRRGIASGCSTSPALFCPGQALTRAQMAVFLVTGFALPLP